MTSVWGLWCVVMITCGCACKQRGGNDPPVVDQAVVDQAVVDKPVVDKPSLAAGSAAAGAQPALRVTLDATPVAIQRVLAIADDDGEIEVHLANFPLTCKHLHERFRPTFDNEIAAKLRLGKQLLPDGTYQWSIRGKYFESTSTESQDAGDALPGVTLDPAAGATSKLVLGYTHETLGAGSSPKRKLVVEGIATVLGCGPMPAPSPPPPPPAPQPGAFLTVAGQPFPIAGAAVIEGDEIELSIGTSEVRCVEGSKHTSTRSELEVELAWDKAGKRLHRAVLDGPLVGWIANQRDPALTAKPVRPRAGAKHHDIVLGGSTKIGDYTVALSGKVRAIVCPAPN